MNDGRPCSSVPNRPSKEQFQRCCRLECWRIHDLWVPATPLRASLRKGPHDLEKRVLDGLRSSPLLRKVRRPQPRKELGFGTSATCGIENSRKAYGFGHRSLAICRSVLVSCNCLIVQICQESSLPCCFCSLPPWSRSFGLIERRSVHCI